MALSEMACGLAARVAELPKLPLGELQRLWTLLFGAPPGALGHSHLVRRLAYRLQEHAGADDCARLTASNRQRIDALLQDQAHAKQRPGRQLHLPPGTVLTRDFAGRTHRVVALADGRLEYRGQRFRSLTAVAGEITGHRWSGPAFFGLKP